MSDARIRLLEREFKEIGSEEVRVAWTIALERSGITEAEAQRITYGFSKHDLVLVKNAQTKVIHLGSPTTIPYSGGIQRKTACAVTYSDAVEFETGDVVGYEWGVGDPDKVTCKTCQVALARDRAWPRMPRLNTPRAMWAWRCSVHLEVARGWGFIPWHCLSNRHQWTANKTETKSGLTLNVERCFYCRGLRSEIESDPLYQSAKSPLVTTEEDKKKFLRELA